MSKPLSLRLNVNTTCAFNDKVDSYYSNTDYYKGTIKGGFQWGGSLEAKLQSQSLELSYFRINSTFPVEYYDGGVKHATPDLASNYILLGSNRFLPVNPKIEPFGGLSIGMCVYHASNPDNGE